MHKISFQIDSHFQTFSILQKYFMFKTLIIEEIIRFVSVLKIMQISQEYMKCPPNLNFKLLFRIFIKEINGIKNLI